MLLGPVELHQHPPASRHPIPQPRTIESLAGQRFCLAAGGSSAAAFAFARVLASRTHRSSRERAREGGREGDGRHGRSAQGAPRRPLLPSRRDRGIGRARPPVPARGFAAQVLRASSVSRRTRLAIPFGKLVCIFCCLDLVRSAYYLVLFELLLGC